MVKRPKLTLDHGDASADEDRSTMDNQDLKKQTAHAAQKEVATKSVPEKKGGGGFGKVLLTVGLTVVSLIVFKRKIF